MLSVSESQRQTMKRFGFEGLVLEGELERRAHVGGQDDGRAGGCGFAQQTIKTKVASR
jgi:hypothetical protein